MVLTRARLQNARPLVVLDLAVRWRRDKKGLATAIGLYQMRDLARVPIHAIVDDAVAEAEEILTVAAWEEANADPWIPRGDSVTVVMVNETFVRRFFPGEDRGALASPAAEARADARSHSRGGR